MAEPEGFEPSEPRGLGGLANRCIKPLCHGSANGKAEDYGARSRQGSTILQNDTRPCINLNIAIGLPAFAAKRLD